MNKETEARWISLLSAIDTLDRFCTENNKDFDNIEIKIPAIKHYMSETIDMIKLMQVKEEVYENNKTMQNIRNRVTQNFFDNVEAKHPHRKNGKVLILRSVYA
jgi:hypothetical protein